MKELTSEQEDFLLEQARELETPQEAWNRMNSKLPKDMGMGVSAKDLPFKDLHLKELKGGKSE